MRERHWISSFVEAEGVCLLLLAFAGAASAQSPAASLSGIVTADEAGSPPVRRALVSITTPGQGSAEGADEAVVTDDAGRFQFPSVAPGRHTLKAAKPGYVTTDFGASRPGRPGTPIQLAAGQRMDLTIRLTRGAVVTGTVRDQDGEVLASARVSLLRYVFQTQTGERALQSTPWSGLSDDRGRYRIYGVTPGGYVAQLAPPFSLPGDLRQATDQSIQSVLARPNEGAGSTGSPVAYAPIFFPGTTSSTEADVLTLAPGEEHAGVDLRLQLLPTARVEGVVSAPYGAPAPNAHVTLIESASGAQPIGGMFASMFGGQPDANGRFTLTGVAPGRYAISARIAPARDASGSMAPALWGATEVEVNGQNLTDVRITLAPGLTVSGRVTFESAAPPDHLPIVRVGLTPLLSGPAVALISPPVDAGAQGAFSIGNLTPGRYKWSATTAGSGSAGSPIRWSLKSAVVNGVETIDDGFAIEPGRGVNEALLRFTDRTTAIEGTLLDSSGRPAPDYFVIVFAAQERDWLPLSRRIAITRPGTDGSFSVIGLPAGDYLIAAVTDVEQGEWVDPSFLKRLVPAAIGLSVADGEAKRQDIRIAGR